MTELGNRILKLFAGEAPDIRTQPEASVDGSGPDSAAEGQAGDGGMKEADMTAVVGMLDDLGLMSRRLGDTLAEMGRRMEAPIVMERDETGQVASITRAGRPMQVLRNKNGAISGLAPMERTG